MLLRSGMSALRRTEPATRLRAGALALTLMLVGCDSAGSAAPLDAGGPAAADAAPIDVAVDVASDAASDQPHDAGKSEASGPPLLTLSLDPTLDQSGDNVKATTITGATLRDEAGSTKAVATVSSGSAAFSLVGLQPGDYFIAVNEDLDDLVPTRVDDPTSSVTQTVGQKLRASYIGPPGSPAYRINTYSAGESESPVVKYSDGTTIPGEQPYVIYSFATSQLEIRLLGTGAPLTSLPLPRCIGHSYDPADGWLLNTTNEDHHGDFFNADGGAVECQTCHWYGGLKKYTYGAIRPTDGWCYECHYGTGGSSAGFVDPTK
jgi:hypothetical protein